MLFASARLPLFVAGLHEGGDVYVDGVLERVARDDEETAQEGRDALGAGWGFVGHLA